MPLVTLTLDRVVDLQRHHGSRFGRQHTLFGIESGGERHAGLYVEGWPEIREGSTITALLRERDDWQTLAGWIEHDSGSIVGFGLAAPILRAAVSIAAAAWCLGFAVFPSAEATEQMKHLAAGIAAVASLSAAGALYAWQRLRSQRALLRSAVRVANPPAP